MKVVIEPIRFGSMHPAINGAVSIDGAAIAPVRSSSLLNANNMCSYIENSVRIQQVTPEHSRHPIQSRRIRP